MIQERLVLGEGLRSELILSMALDVSQQGHRHWADAYMLLHTIQVTEY
jgi:hypothetical protein